MLMLRFRGSDLGPWVRELKWGLKEAHDEIPSDHLRVDAFSASLLACGVRREAYHNLQFWCPKNPHSPFECRLYHR